MSYPIVDGHLDIAGNVLGGRDYTLTAEQLRRREKKTQQQAMVTFPEMRRGGVALAFATLFVGPKEYDGETPIYDPPADEQAWPQVEIYHGWEAQRIVRLVRDRASLEAHLDAWRGDRVPGLMIIMESADPVRDPEDLNRWWDAGVRMIGPAWSRTRYAGGSWNPGPLTTAGRELVAAMRERGVILDASHLAEEAFWGCMDVGVDLLASSHSNCRAIVPGERQLSDDMIRAIGDHDGIAGMCMANGMLHELWRDEDPPIRVTLEDVRKHAEHMAGLIGWDHIGVGSDFDGGLGREETPDDFDTEADLPLVGTVVPEAAREGVLGGNWLRFLRRALP